jgi:carbonic anhydrase
MRLFEAIIEANHRAIAGDPSAGLRPADFADELPIIALTCIDPRLNAILPNVLGVPAECFIWLRNAGNIVTQPLSSTMRSLALACAVKGGKEIAVIGHTDCHVCRTTTMLLLDKLKALGVERSALPDNVNEYFGLFATEQQNVIKACDIVRRSPLIGAKTPVHGLVVDIQTGKLEWVVNGYQSWQGLPAGHFAPKASDEPVGGTNPSAGFHFGEMKFPETKIGETVTKSKDWLARAIEEVKEHVASSHPATTAPAPPDQTPPKQPAPMRIPVPPPIRISENFPRGRR